jgi:hypothetical protein
VEASVCQVITWAAPKGEGVPFCSQNTQILKRYRIATVNMRLDGISLAIGIGIGVAAVTTAMIALLAQATESTLEGLPLIANVVSNNQSHFFMSGLLTNMSDNAMVLDQTFGRPEFNDNPSVTVRLDGGAPFVSCAPTEPANSCKESVLDRLDKEPVYVCVHTRLYNGVFYAGKIWADVGCGPILVGEQVQSEKS